MTLKELKEYLKRNGEYAKDRVQEYQQYVNEAKTMDVNMVLLAYWKGVQDTQKYIILAIEQDGPR